ncbi:hypothetical protein [Massilia genomosp. 1]|uniref:Uncharacterized protein n=1 Tax=Massilia genomosp. 1 TaxID=2609280 RepID=A0ABX0MIM8_9BURK|nr:hypothetical protein [Massilia genomosp. 1]NHZ62640.1 hypothetical protein [Massilia genomosp. 1]
MINEANVKANPGKTQHLLADTSSAACALLQTLMNLDRYLDASGYDASHPWRLEIGAAVTSGKRTDQEHSLRDVAIGRARDAVDMAAIGASFINDNILPAVYALVELIEIHELGDQADRYRRPLLPLAKLTRQLAEEAAGGLESEERAMQAKLVAVEGGQA